MHVGAVYANFPLPSVTLQALPKATSCFQAAPGGLARKIRSGSGQRIFNAEVDLACYLLRAVGINADLQYAQHKAFNI